MPNALHQPAPRASHDLLQVIRDVFAPRIRRCGLKPVPVGGHPRAQVVFDAVADSLEIAALAVGDSRSEHSRTGRADLKPKTLCDVKFKLPYLTLNSNNVTVSRVPCRSFDWIGQTQILALGSGG